MRRLIRQIFVVVAVVTVELAMARQHQQYPVPPPPLHDGRHKMMALFRSGIMENSLREMDSWSPHHKRNIWELSGLLEGDIMTDDYSVNARNAVRRGSAKWSDGVVPYHISDDFDEDEAQVIKGAMDSLQSSTCLKFRPFKEGDSDWISVKSSSPGCWSYVGRQGGGQVVNLGNRCVQHGVAAHELIHALGFYHQQSASDRDKYVTIHWKNIRKGAESNFKRYSSSRITDFDVGYDYDSVMHYSSHAFSKNGKPTITPKDEDATIGQRSGPSEKDFMKLNIMYHCSANPNTVTTEDPTYKFWRFHYR